MCYMVEGLLKSAYVHEYNILCVCVRVRVCVYVVTVKIKCGLDLLSKMVNWTVMNQKIASQNVIQSQRM